MDGRATNVVPCGKCPECLRARANSWAFRLYNEMKQSSSAKFLTFTYDDENQPLSFNGIPTLEKQDFQKFMKRLRKETQAPLKYYACGEYGDQTERPHYHAIMFNLPKSHIINSQPLQNTWQKGHVNIDPCNMATINYTLKYLMKGKFQPQHEEDDRNPLFALMSKKMGLNYLTPAMQKHITQDKKAYATLEGGAKIVLPRYFKTKLYSQSEARVIAKLAQKESEILHEKKFKSEQHHNEWKKDLIRKTEKKLREKTKI